MARRGLKLLLDFVPNHTARDHRWVSEAPRVLHPRQRGRSGARSRRTTRASRLVAAPAARRSSPSAAIRTSTAGRTRSSSTTATPASARRRSPSWARSPQRCDGVRCDMAMLLQPEIIQKTWGDRSLPSDGSPPKDDPFWPEAIPAIRRRHPEFTFIAEVYWDMEWELQQAGFDYTYDKRLYDRLRRRQRDAGARAPVGRRARSRIIRCASSRTTTSRARRRRSSRPRCTRPRRSSRSRRAGCASSTRGSSRDAAFTCRCTSGAGPGSRSTTSCARSTGGCSSVLKRPELHDGSGAWRTSARRGRATRRTSS